jgi:autotransporter-associated beta strand protein
VGGAVSALGQPTTEANGTIDIGVNSAGNTVTLAYTGSGQTSDRILNLVGRTGGLILDQSGSGLLTFTRNLTFPGVAGQDNRKTITLQGSGNGKLGGTIANSSTGTAGQLATSVTKTGSGIWTLSGDNTYTGPTTVSTGKLLIHGNQGLASGATSVAPNATLGGSGTMGGNVTVATNGKLEFDLTTPPGSHNPLDLVAGRTFTFLGASTLTITSAGGASPGQYILVSAPGGFSGIAPATVNLPPDWVASVSIVGNDLVLNVTSAGPSSSYGDWQTANGTNQPVDGDHDGDGVLNGIEWFVHGGTDSSTADASPGVFSNASGLMVIWTKDNAFTGAYGTAFVVESGDTPLGPWTAETMPGRVSIVGNEVRYTFATPLPQRKYAQLKVTGP